ncbi:uncharacterized protein LY79DRAFT_401691 [Colletotrichum navitas]|uniref:Transmembrane protein n=1 Tax=Colletotrichum navitas TaxID=681940 RepID=A0AAD8PPX9_9PEZI|nr:uncharacterized protein LY79DRAFT_401691 [Colletotrichum navitas]KAK1573605.1 hypothetical protein LY79DRAFT_401691 [Colletotrichum navitas]
MGCFFSSMRMGNPKKIKNREIDGESRKVEVTRGRKRGRAADVGSLLLSFPLTLLPENTGRADRILSFFFSSLFFLLSFFFLYFSSLSLSLSLSSSHDGKLGDRPLPLGPQGSRPLHLKYLGPTAIVSTLTICNQTWAPNKWSRVPIPFFSSLLSATSFNTSCDLKFYIRNVFSFQARPSQAWIYLMYIHRKFLSR